jgi:hypothetical protein
LEYRKRRNVLLIFADNARLNIAWPSIVQHLASFHPVVIHHNSTASISSRHVITLRPYLFCVKLLLSCLRSWTTYPFVSNFLPSSIRITIRIYAPSPHPSLPSWPMNSLRPFFRLLFASTRLSLFVLFSPWVWDIGYCHITHKHYKHKTVHTSHNGRGCSSNRRSRNSEKPFWVYPNNRGRTNKLSVNICAWNYLYQIWTRS